MRCEYTFESLAANEAGQVLLAMPMSLPLSVVPLPQALASATINTAPQADGDSL